MFKKVVATTLSNINRSGFVNHIGPFIRAGVFGYFWMHGNESINTLYHTVERKTHMAQHGITRDSPKGTPVHTFVALAASASQSQVVYSTSGFRRRTALRSKITKNAQSLQLSGHIRGDDLNTQKEKSIGNGEQFGFF